MSNHSTRNGLLVPLACFSFLITELSTLKAYAADDSIQPPTKQSTPNTAGKSSGRTSRDMTLRAGVTRTPEEIALCREEETRRAYDDRFAKILLPDEPVLLRSDPVNLPKGGCELATKHWNFFAKDNETEGCFVNAYVYTYLYDAAIPDLATGLMWQSSKSKAVTFEGAKQFINDLNRKKFAGYSDWRIPTTEELLSILEVSRFNEYHLDKWVFSGGMEFWSSDYRMPQGFRWIVDAILADCFIYQADWESRVRAVRTLSKQELAVQRRAFIEKNKE